MKPNNDPDWLKRKAEAEDECGGLVSVGSDGIAEIDSSPWMPDQYGCLNIHVHDSQGRDVHAWLTLRPPYCDRGHIQLNIDGALNIDSADSFPRFFFSFEEADTHTRLFLKWRLWKHRVHPHTLGGKHVIT